MAYKSILVHIDDTVGIESRIRLAARLAHEEKGRLIAFATPFAVPEVAMAAGGRRTFARPVSTLATAGQLEALFKREVAPYGIDTSWRECWDSPTESVADACAAADLIICGNAEPLAERLAVDDVIMSSGRPVLVVPPGIDHLRTSHVLVAWKNTREARRAITDALPILGRSTVVTILHIDESGEGASAGDDVEGFLFEHGIGASKTTLHAKTGAAGDQIIAFARGHAVDLIVLGAFGHSRAREWVFGGVTADLLARSPVPCLFSR